MAFALICNLVAIPIVAVSASQLHDLLPRQTDAVQRAIAARAPAPTEAPTAELLHNRLEVRSDLISVCAYISLSQNSPIVCGGDVPYCGFNTYSSAAGCCSESLGPNSVGGCNFHTACYGANADCDTVCQSNTANLYCPDATAAACRTYGMFDADGNTYLSYGCYSTETFIAAGYTYIDATTALGNSTIVGSTRTTAAPLRTNTSPTTPPTTSTTTVTPSPTPKPSSGTNVGAIAGGVVGGVVFLVAVGVILWLVRRKMRQPKSEYPEMMVVEPLKR